MRITATPRERGITVRSSKRYAAAMSIAAMSELAACAEVSKAEVEKDTHELAELRKDGEEFKRGGKDVPVVRGTVKPPRCELHTAN